MTPNKTRNELPIWALVDARTRWMGSLMGRTDCLLLAAAEEMATEESNA